MTTPQLGSFESIPLSMIRPSGTNPRKHFDDAAMEELTLSVAELGVTQPVLLRPVVTLYNTAAAGETEASMIGTETAFELVTGERRYRAAIAAGRDDIPAIVREMSDEQALDLQMIENLQRADLHPVEEAEGYRVLLSHGATPEDIARKSGKSVGHVQRILKLLSLEVDAKQLYLDGYITVGHALLLARLTPAEQERGIRFLLNGSGDYIKTPLAELIPRRIENLKSNSWMRGKRLIEYTEAQLKEWIEKNVLLQLFNAPWHLADAQLLPVAGACTNCPKRTGANTALFADLTTEDDVCMDPACFAAKGDAQARRQLAAAKDSGTKLLKISAAASNAPLAAPAVQQVKGSTEVVTNQTVKQGQWVPAKEGECNSTVQALVKDGPEKGSVRWVCPDQKCKVHKHTVYRPYSYSATSAPKETLEQIKAREETKQRSAAVTLAVFRRIVDSWAIDTDALLREAIDVQRDWLDEFPWDAVCAWLGVPVVVKKTEDGPEAAERCLQEALPKMNQNELFAVLFLFTHCAHFDHTERRDELVKLAKANGVPKVAAVITDAEKTWDKEHAPAPAAPSTPAKKAAKKAAAKAGA